ncbi:hypothetical protein J1C67_14480 [Clostridium gasigenes]|uniref:hypothetical protein n=1 Tax=Clostridium gasigenes TaxID=94869 RepID=UPI0014384105|nr:hypothetical protein [Clostridium gasigenes]NKF05289.1 hypothetical protein [Clostridium gasigenes]QSW18744.1 hypothetical protein J1C67_14480 [Clostridium gasigenes]
MLKKQTSIMSFQAKDLFSTENYMTTGLRKFKATLDYSLEALKLEELGQELLGEELFYMIEEKQYTNSVISVNFDYSVKDEDGKVTTNTTKLREELYNNGFVVNEAKYVRFKRSNGSSRIGKCLFILEDLYKEIMKWSYMGINHTEGIACDLAALEAYVALTTSSIIDTIQIKPENILLIEDYESIFKTTGMITKILGDSLYTAPEEVEVTNSIWDGQSLMDSSLFKAKYEDKGFLLLRNRFVKTAAFNTNIQQFLKDNNITSIGQLNGKTTATDISQIKFITTPSSIKYLKFGTWEDFISKCSSTWGIVKYDKPTNFYNGKMVQSHYQLLNTLQLDKEEVAAFLKPSMDYINLLKNDLKVFRNHLKMKISEDVNLGTINSNNDLMYNLLQLNDDFANTNVFVNFRAGVIKSYVKNMRKGHILVDGNYSVLFGNAYEMLQASIGTFIGESLLKGNEISCKNFNYNTELIGSRSPHVTMGNLLISYNIKNELINKYFNSSKQIVHINSIGENILERLSGSDFDSDSLLLSTNEILIAAAKKNYNNFLVPTSMVHGKKAKRYMTAAQKADLDTKTSVNLIGESINLSQILNSILWDEINTGATVEEVQGLYADISQLDIMSCIEIDRAKKEFDINNAKELKAIRNKYKIKDEVTGLTIRPLFFKYVGEGQNYSFKSFNTTMDILEESITEQLRSIRCKRRTTNTTIVKLLTKDVKLNDANRHQASKIIERCEEVRANLEYLWISNLENKHDLITQTTNNFVEEIALLKVSVATIKKLLTDISKDKKINKLERSMLLTLYNAHTAVFKELFIEVKKPIKFLKLTKNIEECQVQIYSLHYKVITK